MKVKIEFEVSQAFIDRMCEKYGYEESEVVELIENVDDCFQEDYELMLDEVMNIFDN
jgi:Mn-dependent DtxR family transcriptional regulator